MMRHSFFLFALVTIVGSFAKGSSAQQLEPVRVFVLAGQSNMEGQAVVDLAGKDYNDGKGTLLALLNREDCRDKISHLLTEQGRGKPRDDVWVRA